MNIFVWPIGSGKRTKNYLADLLKKFPPIVKNISLNIEPAFRQSVSPSVRHCVH